MVVIDRHQQMNVIEHDNKFVQQELPGIAIPENRLNQQIGGLTPLKEVFVHICRSRHKISLRHKYLRAKARPSTTLPSTRR